MLKITSDCQTGRLEPSPQEGASMAIILHCNTIALAAMTLSYLACLQDEICFT